MRPSSPIAAAAEWSDRMLANWQRATTEHRDLLTSMRLDAIPADEAARRMTASHANMRQAFNCHCAAQMALRTAARRGVAA